MVNGGNTKGLTYWEVTGPFCRISPVIKNNDQVFNSSPNLSRASDTLVTSP